jgi:hypothetical protein
MVNQVQQAGETGRNRGAAQVIANAAVSAATAEATTAQAARTGRRPAVEQTATTTADAGAASAETLIRPVNQTDQASGSGQNALGSLTIVVSAKARAR